MEIESANCKFRVSECEDIEQLSVDYPVKCERKIDGLETLVQELHRVFSKSHVNIQEVQSLMSAYKSDPKQWRKFAKFDRFRYTRNLVDAGNGLFNIMILCWGPGHASAIHDHADSHCFMKLLSGSLDEVRYEWPNNVEPEIAKKLKTKSNRRTLSENEQITENSTNLDVNENDRCQKSYQNGRDGCQNGHNEEDCGYDAQSMKEIGRTRLEVDDVCYINDAQGLHRMENPSHVDGAVSLHLYCPPFDSCRVFDSRTGKSTEVKVTFWSMYGKKNKMVIETNPSDDQD
ncbi:cysteine dioxygenase type 1 [Maniola jurtina]|uniref:cysteine dioxygenase type 1 n=1 Tax=Maniola jurtina TaxID=191418 RepID=UPI001E688FEC|nr:cysteine dioxygenase type 1 [Maniola jurtina]XP_045782656.1 cysteine dioxygenase type 1 [Maniola jurtina]